MLKNHPNFANGVSSMKEEYVMEKSKTIIIIYKKLWLKRKFCYYQMI